MRLGPTPRLKSRDDINLLQTNSIEDTIIPLLVVPHRAPLLQMLCRGRVRDVLLLLLLLALGVSYLFLM